MQGAARALLTHRDRRGLDLQARCFETFARLIEHLDLPEAQAWDRAPESRRVDWNAQLDQLLGACSFLAAGCVPPVERPDALRQELETLRVRRQELLDERRRLAAQAAVDAQDVGVLEADVELLRAALELADLRRHLANNAAADQGRRQANRRLADQARHNVDELMRLGKQMEEAERRREELLANNLEQDQTFWDQIKERIG